MRAEHNYYTMGRNISIFKIHAFARNYFIACIFFYYLYSSFTGLYFVLPMRIPSMLFISGILLEGLINGWSRQVNVYIVYASFSLICLFIWDWFIGNYFNGLIGFIPIMLLFLTKHNVILESFRKITKWYSYIISISIILYIITNLTVISPISVISVERYSDFNNYLFYLQNLNKINLDFIRFNGPFVEPGHLAMASCFMLIANGLKFNKYLLPIYLSVVLSFSLAGYVVLCISLILFRLNSIRALFRLLIGIILVTTVVLSLDEDNPFNNLIIARLEYDQTKGIEGNNRFHGETDKIFNEMIKSQKILMGVGEEEFKNYLQRGIIDGAGYKIYFLEKGIIGFIILLSIYIFILLSSKNHSYMTRYLIIIIIAFLQRSYMSSFSWIYLFYVTSLMNYATSKLKKGSSLVISQKTFENIGDRKIKDITTLKYSIEK